ncbi:14115_t:CDS:2 [Racocetra fulgida]|uniref:14115_t:CDS:1 n=1 Tax=Racocetra fulgida TaxID=60492 RepID=A0A9N8WEV7_9GLOM|nr:14115_t:CDS:2 [Racocetra fulgida]
MASASSTNFRGLTSKPSSRRSHISSQLFDQQLQRLCPSPHYHPKIEDPIREIVDVLLSIFLQEQLKCTSNKKLKTILTMSIENYRVETNKKKAFSLFLAAAKKGYLIAQEMVGDCYFFGIGTHENEDLAFLWYNKCAEQGSGYGYHGLGICYEYGKGTELCLSLAIEYYRMSAIRGNVWGMIQLARRYQAGIGTPKNIDKAIYWYQKALEIGCEKAKTELDNLMKLSVTLHQKHDSERHLQPTIIEQLLP